MAKKDKVKERSEEDQEGAGQVGETAEGTEDPKSGDENVFTYVGGGESSPRRIHFMGKHVFTRGVPTKVEDPSVLAKLKGHPCFTQEEVDQDSLHDMDEEADKAADAQRQRDAKTNASVLKKMASWGKKGEEE